jgi:dipeptidyl aminopeptidase/acylaminoacyl peptidase
MATVFDWQEAQAVAELGFIVMALDGRGTPHRSKGFLNESYGHMDNAGDLDDHVAALTQLAGKRSYMDLDRLGAYGHSAGGFAAARAILQYPEIFSVAVSSSGVHDLRGYLTIWAETYNGPDDGRNYLAASNIPLAPHLRGKLLLVHGDMDDNVHPSETLRLADALIRSNRNFDLLIIPNANHAAVTRSPYFIRRRWDYLVRNLRGEEPPQFEVKAPSDDANVEP